VEETMGLSVSDRIEELVEALTLDKVYLESMSNCKPGHKPDSFCVTMSKAHIDFFEWDLAFSTVYVSNLILLHSGIESLDNVTLIEVLRKVFDDANLVVYLEGLLSVYSGAMESQSVDVVGYSYENKAEGLLRVTFFNILNRDKNSNLITSITQDVTTLSKAMEALADSKIILDRLFMSMPKPVLYFNSKGVIEFSNEAVCEIVGVDSNTILGMHKSQYRELMDKRIEIKKKVYTDKKNNVTRFEATIKKAKKECVYQVDVVEVLGEMGMEKGQLYVFTDITNRIEDMNRIKKLLSVSQFISEIESLISERVSVDVLYSMILKGLMRIVGKAETVCILHLTQEGNLVMRSNIGYDDDFAENFNIPFAQSYAKFIMHGNYNKSCSVTNIHENYSGKFVDIVNESRGFKLESNITVPLKLYGELFGLISIDSSKKNAFDGIDLDLLDFVRNKIELSLDRYQELLDIIDESNKDDLTGLYNRKFFLKLTNKLMEESKLCDGNFILVMFDLDGLKQVNDTMGHLAGDALIKEFAAIVTVHKREADIFARIGGDEFIGVFPNATVEVIKKKLQTLADYCKATPLVYEHQQIIVAFSFGMIEFPKEGQDLEDLIELADRRMYVNKTSKNKRL